MIQIPLKRATIVPPAKSLHLNGVSLAGRWWFYIECWFQTSFAKEPYSFVIFQMRGCGPPVRPLDPRMKLTG